MPSLNWIGKEKIITHHAEVPFRLLEHRYGFNCENPEDKRWLGNKWADLAGDNYKYFMVFQNKEVDNAITIKQLLQYLDEM